ncbi:MAG TPA: MBL fold metallo-hydrolase [Thermoleophilia bacterium]|nr:MBL fold metallo-hydrolase [Thermoleophilia bacterium]
MSEPREIADRAELVAPGLWHWRIANSRLGGATSSSQAFADGDGAVLVDPLRLAPEALADLPRPAAAVLTAKCHQRSAWRYRAEFGIEVWAPLDAPPADEKPDHHYGEGDRLPGGLRAVLTPGPEPIHYCLLLEQGGGVLFCSDLLARGADGDLRFVPPEYHDDPAETRRSVERLLQLDFSILCLDHGPPVVDDPHAAIARLLGG